MATTPNMNRLDTLPPEYFTEDIHHRLLDFSIIFIVIPTFIFVLFCLSRWVNSTRSSWSVWVLVTCSYLCIVGLCTIGIVYVEYGGAGFHIENYILHDPAVLIRFGKIQTAAEFVYCLSIMFPKLCLLNLYLQIFENCHVVMRRLTWVVIVVVVLQWISIGVIGWATVCTPFAYKWDKTIKGSCTHLLPMYRYVSIPNVLTDLAILVLPLPMVWKLRVSRLSKIGIFITIFIGGLGIVAAVIRFVGFFDDKLLLKDHTWAAVNATVLSIGEASAYFICSCLPYIRPLLRYVFQETGIDVMLARYKLGAFGESPDRPSFLHTEKSQASAHRTDDPGAFHESRLRTPVPIEDVESRADSSFSKTASKTSD